MAVPSKPFSNPTIKVIFPKIGQELLNGSCPISSPSWDIAQYLCRASNVPLVLTLSKPPASTTIGVSSFLYAPHFPYSLCWEGFSPHCPSLKLYPKATFSEESSLPCLYLMANNPSYSLVYCRHRGSTVLIHRWRNSYISMPLRLFLIFSSSPFPPLYVVGSTLRQALVSSCTDYYLAWPWKVCTS